MKIILEALRFTLVFFILSAIIGMITHISFLEIGIAPDKYSWIGIIGVFMLTFAIYKHKGWGKVFHKKILWTTLILMILLAIFIPDVAPAHLHTDKYVYSYGFPFNFLTLYVGDESKFLLPNLVSQNFTGWSLSMGMLGNFIIFYFSLRFLFKYFSKLHTQKTYIQ